MMISLNASTPRHRLCTGSSLERFKQNNPKKILYFLSIFQKSREKVQWLGDKDTQKYYGYSKIRKDRRAVRQSAVVESNWDGYRLGMKGNRFKERGKESQTDGKLSKVRVVMNEMMLPPGKDRRQNRECG